jgi:hypothetical protein
MRRFILDFGEMAAADRAFVRILASCWEEIFWKQLEQTFHFCDVNCDVTVWMANPLPSSSSLQVTTSCLWCQLHGLP